MNYLNTKTNKSKISNKKNIIFLIVILCLLLSLTFVACKNNNDTDNDKNTIEDSFKDLSSNTVGNSSQNINSDGYIASQIDWFYYSNGKGLYKVKTDNTERQQISLDKAKYINVVGDWIYFYSQTDDLSGIFKIRIDGSERQYLGTGKYYLNVVNDWIYFMDNTIGDYNYGIYRMRTDGSKKELLINENISNIYIIDDYIYYRLDKDNDGGFYKVKTDGTQSQRFYTDEFLSQHTSIGVKFVVEGEWLYYNKQYIHVDNQKGIYKIKVDGTEWQPVFTIKDGDTNEYSEELNGFTLQESSIYYSLNSYVPLEKTTNHLYKIKINDSEKQLLNINSLYNYSFDDYLICRVDIGNYPNQTYKFDIYDKNDDYLFTIE